MVWGAAYLYTPEVLPTPIRALGLGACSAVSSPIVVSCSLQLRHFASSAFFFASLQVTRVAGMLSPGLGQMLSGRDMLGESIVLYAMIYAVGGLVTLALPHETSGGGLNDGATMHRGTAGGEFEGETEGLFSEQDAMASDDDVRGAAARSSGGGGGGGGGAGRKNGKRGYTVVDGTAAE